MNNSPKTYDFRPILDFSGKCYKRNCIWFEKKYADDGTIVPVGELCGCHPEICCDDLMGTWGITEQLKSDDIHEFYNIMGGYSNFPEYTLEHPTCPDFTIFFNISEPKTQITQISGMTLKFFTYIKEQLLCSTQLELEIILLLFKRILSLEEIIERWEIKAANPKDSEVIQNQELLAEINQLKIENSKIRKDYNHEVDANRRLTEIIVQPLSNINQDKCKSAIIDEQLKLNKALTRQSDVVIDKISTYINSVFDRIKATPGEYISEQDLLQILVFIDE